MRVEQVLPDSLNEVAVDGVTVRKGTVGAFLANARVWTDPRTSAAARADAWADIADALPALRVLGLFDVLAVRDAALRERIDAVANATTNNSSSNAKETS